MKKLALIANTTKERTPDVLRRLAAKARALGLELAADGPTAELAPGVGAAVIGPGQLDGIDAVMALGGDGTMLRAFRLLGGKDVPLIGVNLGSLGFLTSVAENDLERVLDCLAQDEVTFSRRSVADCVVRRGERETGRYAALNDVVISSAASARIVKLDVTLGGDRVARYSCDGVVVSTPTGSTGHNLSAGGPIVVPETRAFVISVICPHTLSSRPLVVPESFDITLQASYPREGGLRLSVDGQIGKILEDDEVVHVQASASGVRFIHLPGYSYFSVLSQKLGWKGSNTK